MKSCDWVKNCATNTHQITDRKSLPLRGKSPSMIWEMMVGASTDSELVGSQISSEKCDWRRSRVSDCFAQCGDTKLTACHNDASCPAIVGREKGDCMTAFGVRTVSF